MSTLSDGDLQLTVDTVDGDDKPSYKYAFTYERATLYEYKFERQPDPDPIDPCHRCNKGVPREEQVNVGVLFHKQCFRCRICGLPLTPQTFYRNNENGNTDKEVYCRSHLGKQIGQVEEGDDLDIENSHQANKRYVIQIAGKSKNSPGASSNSDHSPGSSITNVTPRSITNGLTPGSWSYGPNSLDYSTYTASGRPIPRPRSTLQSFQDFEISGVFEAQSHLEQRHTEEEERLQRFISEEREKELHRLNEGINAEKERAAAELLASMDQMSLQRNSRDLFAERERIEDHFRRAQEDRLRIVMDKVASEEKTRMGKMVERHGQEMMLLIAEKDRESDKNALFDHSMRPPILPPETKKSQLYTCPTSFESLDKKAIDLAKREFSSYTDLVKELTRDCKNELDKARVVFRWVIAKDLSKHSVNEIIKPNMSASILRGVKSGKETYHQLYKKMCSYAGLHCEIILGYSKGAGYKPGMRIEGNSFRNSWTAVAIDGNWRFVNCTWAARHVTGHVDDLPQIYHKYDEFYFLTDPENYIYQHYPDDPSWQLMEIPLPFSEFLNLPVVKSPFFNYGLRFYSNYGATLKVVDGMVEIKLIMPKILGFGSLLEPMEKRSSEPKVVEGRTLLRLVKNEAIFTVSLPRAGMYYFSIYTGDYWHSDCLESACSFVISCPKLPGLATPPYPPVPYYGPTPVLEKLGIVLDSHTDPLIVFNSDILELTFKMSKDIKVTHTFQYYEVKDGTVSDIDRYVFLKSRNDKGAVYLMRCPKEGFYIFSLYASETSGENHSLDCVYRYLVVCQEPNPSVNEFPKTYHNWQRCTLHEPLSGDLVVNRRYNFRVDVPQAVEVFVVVADVWHHLRRKIGFTWEGSIASGAVAGTLKIYARFSVQRDASIFSHLLDFEIINDHETEI